ncbi:hypothetical protein ABZP36_016896 [Zizania latifolia]
MSSISSIALLSKLGVEDLSELEEKTVKIGCQEGLEINSEGTVEVQDSADRSKFRPMAFVRTGQSPRTAAGDRFLFEQKELKITYQMSK